MAKRFAVEMGALTEVPVYESHGRGKNWLAKITTDPNSPGGIAREFVPKAKGEFFYLIEGLEESIAVEFGADYYSSSGKKNPKRYYGVIIKVETDGIEIEEKNTTKEAIKYAESLQEDISSKLQQLYEKKERLQQELNEVEKEIQTLEIENQ